MHGMTESDNSDGVTELLPVLANASYERGKVGVVRHRAEDLRPRRDSPINFGKLDEIHSTIWDGPVAAP